MSQPDLQEQLRRRRLAQIMSEQGQANAGIPDISQPDVTQGGQDKSVLNSLLPYPSPVEGVQAPTSTAARDAYAEFLKQPQPDIRGFHPSVGRRIAATVLGGLAGAGGRPEAGREFLYEPFSRQQAAYQQIGGRLKEAAQTEIASEKEKFAGEELVTRRKAEEERAGAERARRTKEEFEGSPEGREFELKKITAQREPSLEKDVYDLDLQDGSKVIGARYQVVNGTGQYVGPDGKIYGSGSVKSASKQSPEKKLTSALQDAQEAFVREHSRLPNYQENLKIIEDIAKAQGLFQKRTEEEGTWVEAEDREGNPVLYNTKTTEVKPAPQGIRRLGTKEKEETQKEKVFGPAQDAIGYADTYMQSNKFDGPGDEALLEKFFELAKPSTGFRMTDAQIKLLMRARSLTQSAAAKFKHSFTPDAPWFDDVQRKNIYRTMQDLAKAKLRGSKEGTEEINVPGFSNVHEVTP